MAFDRLKASWEASTIKVFYDIVALESGQGLLPISTKLMGGCLAAYALGQAAVHLLDHEPMPALLFGVSSAAVVGAGTAGVLQLYKQREKTIQTITALAGVGAFIALVSIILHQRLVNFLLFPIVLWLVFSFAFIFRHAGLRTIPAFAFAATIAIVIDYIFATLMH